MKKQITSLCFRKIIQAFKILILTKNIFSLIENKTSGCMYKIRIRLRRRHYYMQWLSNTLWGCWASEMALNYISVKYNDLTIIDNAFLTYAYSIHSICLYRRYIPSLSPQYLRNRLILFKILQNQ